MYRRKPKRFTIELLEVGVWADEFSIVDVSDLLEIFTCECWNEETGQVETRFFWSDLEHEIDPDELISLLQNAKKEER